MTMDRTLKTRGRLKGNRSVLTRAERIAHLTDEGKFDPEADSPLGLAKTKVRRSRAGHKAKKAAAEETVAEEVTAEGEEATGDEAKSK